MAAENKHIKNCTLTKLQEQDLARKLSRATHFTEKETLKVISIFKAYTKDKKLMEKQVFMEMLHNNFGLNEEFFMSRVFHTADTNRDGRIDIEEFTHMISVMVRGTTDQKSQFCFTCYDLNENNQLGRDEIATLITQSMTEIANDNPDVVLDLIEMILQRLDKDGDGVLSRAEFTTQSNEDWIIGESFGQCIPDHKHRASFLVLLDMKEDFNIPSK